MKNYTLIYNKIQHIKNEIKLARQKVILNPVIYDEVTNFKDATSYPFEKRKNLLPTVIVPKDTLFEYNPWSREPGQVSKIFLNLNYVCYDKNWYSDLLFWNSDEYCEDYEENR